jgi:hypothetical protein
MHFFALHGGGWASLVLALRTYGGFNSSAYPMQTCTDFGTNLVIGTAGQ